MSDAAPDLDELDTTAKLLLHIAANWPDATAMREKRFGVWERTTWRGYADAVREIALGAKARGFARGEVAALIGRNRPNWVWCQLAAQALGGMSMGVYADALGEEALHLIDLARARIAFCEDEEQVDKLLELGERARSIRTIVYADPKGMRKYDDPRLVSLEALRAEGRALDAREPGLFEREAALGSGDDVGFLCTTSGTTARPKIAMLAHGPFLRHCARYLEADPRGPGDDYVCLLPLPWIMEQVYVIAMPLLSRIAVNFPESDQTGMRDLREIGPTHLLLAPRVWEQLAADVRARMMDANRVNRWVFDFSVERGRAAVEKGGRDPLAEFLLFGALRDRLGFAKIKSAATGGAALGPETFKFFLAMGVPLRQLYGQTELSGAYTLQRGDALDFDSCGVPFEGVEIRIDAPDPDGIGEILTRHGGMFEGYFENEEATRASFAADGFMRTGDAGFLDAEGKLTVIDRVADLRATEDGHKFSPQYVENKLKFSPYVGECVIFGGGRPFLSALLCIRYEMAAKWAEARRIAFTTYANLSARDEVYDLLAREVETVNATLPAAQKIRRFVLLFKALDADDGELTRTRKVRRGVIDERYAAIVDAIYRGDDRVVVETEVTFEGGRSEAMRAEIAIRDVATASEKPEGRAA